MRGQTVLARMSGRAPSFPVSDTREEDAEKVQIKTLLLEWLILGE